MLKRFAKARNVYLLNKYGLKRVQVVISTFERTICACGAVFKTSLEIDCPDCKESGQLKKDQRAQVNYYSHSVSCKVKEKEFTSCVEMGQLAISKKILKVDWIEKEEAFVFSEQEVCVYLVKEDRIEFNKDNVECLFEKLIVVLKDSLKKDFLYKDTFEKTLCIREKIGLKDVYKIPALYNLIAVCKNSGIDIDKEKLFLVKNLLNFICENIQGTYITFFELMEQGVGVPAQIVCSYSQSYLSLSYYRYNKNSFLEHFNSLCPDLQKMIGYALKNETIRVEDVIKLETNGNLNRLLERPGKQLQLVDFMRKNDANAKVFEHFFNLETGCDTVKEHNELIIEKLLSKHFSNERVEAFQDIAKTDPVKALELLTTKRKKLTKEEKELQKRYCIC